jgi:hypothetical protein
MAVVVVVAGVMTVGEDNNKKKPFLLEDQEVHTTKTQINLMN